jgi:hypothetical protein
MDMAGGLPQPPSCPLSFHKFLQKPMVYTPLAVAFFEKIT